MMVGANIPLEKADDPNMRTWLNKYVQGSGDLPVANTLRENYLPKLGEMKQEYINPPDSVFWQKARLLRACVQRHIFL